MDNRDVTRRTVREPVRSPWVWMTMSVLILGGVPFYLPTGGVDPVVAGVPYWMAISIAFTFAFAAFTSWLCLRWWNLVEDEEERHQADALAGRDAEGETSWES